MHDRHWNLVVAATGTGKTVLAAPDYRHLYRESGAQPPATPPFVAHRREILERGDGHSGSPDGSRLWRALRIGGGVLTVGEHVFASVQSLLASDVQKILAITLK